MKTLSIRALILIMAMSFNLLISTAQTTKTVGGAGANYSTLKLAFDAINSGSVTGVITLQITGSTTEIVSASINASGIGNANYSSVRIYPTGSGYSISSNFNSPTINLNAANNITIDGRVNCSGSTADLTIKNLSTGNSSPAIRLVNSAQNNDIKYCNVYASTINTSTGIIHFSSATTGTGNSNNIIENCNISNAGGNRPINAILVSGSSGHENNANIIRNNNFYDFLNQSYNSNGVNMNSCAIGNIVSGNSFYETTNFAPTGKFSYRAISITTLENQIISSNFIGGSAPQCGGTPWIINSNFAHYWCGIYVSGGNSTSAQIENNLISNILDTSTEDNPLDGIYINAGNVDVIGNTIGSSTGNNSIVIYTPVAYATSTLTDGVITSINIVGGGSGYTVAPAVTFSIDNGGTGVTVEAEITNGVVTKINILNGGSGYTSAPSVSFEGQTNMYSTSHGMIQNSNGIVNISNNNIGSITTYGTDTYSHGWESVYVRSVTGTTTFDGNLIGSLTTPNSIHTGQGSPNSRIKLDLYGIYSSSVGTTIIKNNTVANLTNNYTGTNTGSRTRGIQTIAGSNTIQNNTVRNITSFSAQNGSRTTAAVIGISQISGAAGTSQIISGNFVNNIISANSSARIDVYGILYIGPTSGTNYVYDNFVHSISATSTNTACEIDGIVLNLGLTSCFNNIINLGMGVSTGYKFNGIVDDSGTNNFNSIYFNSIYLGGTVSGTTSSTAALLNNSNITTRIYKNNILYNARSGGSTGKHYSAILAGNSGLTINYNDYYVSGTNSVLMKYGSIDETTLAAIKTATGQDINSLSTNPLYTNAGGIEAMNYYSAAPLNGIAVSEITTDYGNLARNPTPKMGALETNNYVWQGGISTDFGTAGNWIGGSVPPNGSEITFATTPVRNCVLDQNRILANITNAQSNYKFVLNGKQLTLTGNLIFTNGAQIDATTTSSTLVFGGLSMLQNIQSSLFVNNIIDGLSINNSNGVVLNGNLIVNQLLTLNSGSFTIGSNTLTLNGTISTNSGTLIGGSSSNLIFGGSTANTVLQAISLNNLSINRANGITLGGQVNLAGNLTVEQNSTIELNNFNHFVSGNIVCNGLITSGQNTGSVTMNGIAAQSIEGAKSSEAIFTNLIISNPAKVQINKDVSVKNNMTINSGCGITINPTFKVNVIGSIFNNAGISGIYIKSSPTAANGSLIFHNSSNSPVNATVEMYSKANWNLNNQPGSKYQWQFFGIPVKTMNISDKFSNCYVRKWNETGTTDYDLWNMMPLGSTMTSFTGYEIVQSIPTTYTFTGQLENSDFNCSMTFTSASVFPGQHIYGNPYTAAIDISKIEFGADTEASVYLYNTGNYINWLANSGYSSPGSNPGQYTVTTKQTAGLGGIPGQIPSMQGFLIKALKSDATISIPYSSVIQNVEMQRVSVSKNDIPTLKVFTRIEVKSATYSDCMWIFSDSTCKRTFDNGWDGNKILGTVQNPQLFAVEPDGDYQIDAVPDMNETYLGFIAGQETEYKLSFTHQNVESKYANIYLVDLVENKTVDITENGSEYSFTAQTTPNSRTRFKIITIKNQTAVAETLLKMEQQQKSIVLKNNSENYGELIIYNVSGSILKRFSFSSNSMINFSTADIQPGIYLVKAFTNVDEITEKLLIR